MVVSGMRRWWLWIVVAVAGLSTLWFCAPSDRTPKGAYSRVAAAVNNGSARALFVYLETPAQHSAFTIHKYSVQAVERINAAYPPELAERERERFSAIAALEPGPGVFEWYAARYNWLDQLRRDLSGVASVDVSGERATVETVRGSRYAFRRRDNGRWGLTTFTARLVADAEKSARDYSVIEAAAADYERASGRR